MYMFLTSWVMADPPDCRTLVRGGGRGGGAALTAPRMDRPALRWPAHACVHGGVRRGEEGGGREGRKDGGGRVRHGAGMHISAGTHIPAAGTNTPSATPAASKRHLLRPLHLLWANAGFLCP